MLPHYKFKMEPNSNFKLLPIKQELHQKHLHRDEKANVALILIYKSLT